MSITPSRPSAPSQRPHLVPVPPITESRPDARSTPSAHQDYRARHTEDSSRTLEQQDRRGKLTARQRITLLTDPDSFVEVGAFRKVGAAPVGVIGGTATIHGHRVYVYAQDFTVGGGALGAAEADEIVKLIELATAAGAPIIGLNDSGGAKIQDGAIALDGYGRIFRAQVAASGVVPQIAVVLGPCAGGASYSPALADFTFMVQDISFMYLTGPRVVELATGSTVTHEELGGGEVHSAVSGLSTMLYPDEESCLEDIRFLVSLLPANYLEGPGHRSEATPDDVRPTLTGVVPSEPNQPYDVHDVIEPIVDDEDLFEVFPTWAPNIVCGLARVGGATLGIVANQPMHMTGALDGEASEKAARFIRFCDAFGIPLLTLVDVPGFLPGLDQERAGIIRRGAKLLYAYCDATVPRLQVILRKAFGGAYIVMDSRSVGCDLSFAWPLNQVAVMGAASAVEIVNRHELAAGASREDLVAEYENATMHPYYAAERGLVDDVIDPAQTRVVVLNALAAVSDKRPQQPARRHGNMPL